MRKALVLIGLMWGVWSSVMAAPPRLAAGLIVKLKDTGSSATASSSPGRATASSLLRLQATLRPAELPSRTRVRMSTVATRQGVSFATQRPTAFGAQVIRKTRVMSYEAAEAEAQRLRRDPEVEWVVVNEIAWPQAALATNDPRLSQQGWIQDRNDGGYPNVPAAFARLQQHVSSTGRSLAPVVVAVLDSGVLRHPDLTTPSDRVKFSGGYDFVSEVEYANDGTGLDPDATDPGDYLTSGMKAGAPAVYELCPVETSSWHGTMTAGVLAAAGDNGVGIVGLLAPLPGSPVLPVRVAGNCGAAVSDIIEGMLWAAGVDYNGSPLANPTPARVISFSFGGSESCSCANKADLTRADAGGCLYQNAIDALKAKGALLVAASGNGDGVEGFAAPTRPASCPGVLAVTALNSNGRKAQYANFAGRVGVATLGGDPDLGDGGLDTLGNSGDSGPTTVAGLPTDDYIEASGTSFATPLAAGTVALMWAVNPSLTVDQILTAMQTSGRAVRAHATSVAANCSSINTGSCDCTTTTCGGGILDVDSAVAWAASQPYGTFTANAASATWFVPDRLASRGVTGGSSGGGGGSVGSIEALVLALWAAGGVVWSWRRQAHGA